MRRRKTESALFLLFVILCEFQIEALSNNTTSLSTNVKELQEMETKFEDCHKAIIEIWVNIHILLNKYK